MEQQSSDILEIVFVMIMIIHVHDHLILLCTSSFDKSNFFNN